MGSTDSAGDSHHSGAGSCGLVSSLFPNSCRGRAEAFARRLHRRLTSLGGTDVTVDENDESHYNEKDSLNTVTDSAWLQSSNYKSNSEASTALISRHVLEHQPRYSPESNLFYDLDLSTNEGANVSAELGSPDEIASPDKFINSLVNRTNNIDINYHDNDGNHDSESGYNFSSPLGASSSNESNNETYYDPESLSESDKIHTEDYYDPIYTSESDAACDLTYDQANYDCQQQLGRRRPDLQKEKTFDDTSESSASFNENIVDKLNDTKTKWTRVYSSEESLNEIASTSVDTTSQSHESLWSTFDDTTVSHNENPSIATISSKDTSADGINKQLLLEYNQTKIPIVEINSQKPSINNETNDINKFLCKNSDDKVQSLIHLGNGELEFEKDDDSTYSSTIDIPSALVVECAMMNNSESMTPEKILKTEINLNDSTNSDNNFVNTLCLSYGNNDDENEEETKKMDEEKNEEVTKEDEEEFEEERPQRLRRSSSLKTGKTPPGTPGRKKIVRFADVLGLDLADVRTFLDEIPKVPNSAFSDLVYDDVFRKDGSPNFYDNNLSCDLMGQSLNNMTLNSKFNGLGLKPDKMLVPLFQQPGGLPNYLDIVRDRQVCLENVIVQDAIAMCIQGTVRVRNLDFHKSVHIRYTLDSWKNYSDLQACYVNNSCDGFSDKFKFQLYCHTLKIGHKLELAVRFQCKGAQYWDNNGGVNYCFQCLPMTPAINYIPITSLTSCSTHDWSPTFY